MTVIQLTSVICTGCRMPASVDADHLCEFCRRPVASQDARRTLWLRAAILAAIVAFGVIAAALMNW